MISWTLRQLNRLPRPWNFVVAIGLGVVFIILGFYLFSQVRSCAYDKSRAEYAEKEKEWATERARLVAEAEAKEKRIAELEPQVLAFHAAAEVGKKVDVELAGKIEEIGKEAADAEIRATEPADCAVRAARVCELLRANRIPHDCGAITRESCAARQ